MNFVGDTNSVPASCLLVRRSGFRNGLEKSRVMFRPSDIQLFTEFRCVFWRGGVQVFFFGGGLVDLGCWVGGYMVARTGWRSRGSCSGPATYSSLLSSDGAVCWGGGGGGLTRQLHPFWEGCGEQRNSVLRGGTSLKV